MVVEYILYNIYSTASSKIPGNRRVGVVARCIRPHTCVFNGAQDCGILSQVLDQQEGADRSDGKSIRKVLQPLMGQNVSRKPGDVSGCRGRG